MKGENVLILDLCKERLHGLEFVRPIKDIVEKDSDFVIKHYSNITDEDLEVADKVIICGTSLMDNKFLENLDKFLWLKDYSGSVLGICAGMQAIGAVFGEKLKEKKEIGYYREKLNKNFLGLVEDYDEGEYSVWHLHNKYSTFDKSFWEIFMTSSGIEKIPQAVKHKEKRIYGVLFHPEVRQKEMISEFVKNG